MPRSARPTGIGALYASAWAWSYDAAGVRAVAAEAIRKAVQAKDNPADLINVALEELVRAQCELPGHTTLDELTKKIRTEVNRGFFTLVAGRVDAAARARLGVS